jgi:hypothetical protein
MAVRGPAPINAIAFIVSSHSYGNGFIDELPSGKLT